MTTRIAFLRAVNLGKRKVQMTRLIEVFRAQHYQNVWTHINSGNVVFDAAGARTAIESAVESACQAEFGFECTTFIRTAAELAKIVDNCPFPIEAGDTHFVTFLKNTPNAEGATALQALSNDFDTLIVSGRDVHWRMRGKSTDSKLTKRNWEKILGTNSSTSRNMNMLEKLSAKIESHR